MSMKPDKPETRKAPAAKRAATMPVTSVSTLKLRPRRPCLVTTEEMEIDVPGRAIIDAQEVLAEANYLTDAVRLIALELNEYECGAICSVADAIKTKISDGLDLIEAYRKESGLATRQVEAARKAMGPA